MTPELNTIYGLYQKSRGPVRRLAKDLMLVLINELLHEGDTLSYAEVYIGQHEGKIAAIREYRTRTGAGLKEAKDAVENHFAKNDLKFFGY